MKKKQIALIVVIILLLVFGLLRTDFVSGLFFDLNSSKLMENSSVVFKHDFDDWTYIIVENPNGNYDIAYLNRKNIFNKDFYSVDHMYEDVSHWHGIENQVYSEFNGTKFYLKKDDGTLELYMDQTPKAEYFTYDGDDYVFMYIESEDVQSELVITQ